MPTAIKKAAAKKTHKKEDHDIISKLEEAVMHLKEVLGDKKFASRIKKAAKLLLKGNKKTKTKKAAKPATKKTSKKAAKPAVKKAAKPATKSKKA